MCDGNRDKDEEENAMIPDELKYTKEHEWLRLQGGEAVMGITEHAQNELGDIVYVELPKVGQKLKAGEACAVVESVKAVSDVYAPASGTVTEVNTSLEDHPEKINEDPYGEGWIAKIALDEGADLSHLMDAEGYRAFLEGN